MHWSYGKQSRVEEEGQARERGIDEDSVGEEGVTYSVVRFGPNMSLGQPD